MSSRTQNLELITNDAADDDVPAEVKRTLIEQDIQMWRNTRWQAESRLRAYTRNNMPEQAKEQVELVARCEGMIRDYEAQLNELSKD